MQPGTKLGHYEILAPLGAGGMGEVYRARDTTLDREVAIKVLPEDFAGDPDRLARFEVEAKAVAAINHPNIVTIYSIEQLNGRRLLTMELVEGRSLNEAIPAAGLSLQGFFPIAEALAEALVAAHDRGITHRDLKPDNVMLDGNGRVKVLDFGLAKLLAADDVAEAAEMATRALTGEGVVLGTVPYMSPEQLEGRAVDHRTDIFSLGVVLYEMATGEQPFQGSSLAATSSAILRDTPPPVTERNLELPRHLGRIIEHCLQKSPLHRYQSARDVLNELQGLHREIDSGVHVVMATAAQTATPAPQAVSDSTEDRSIAVLPFINMSADPEQEYFCDGMAEDLITALSRVAGLRVAPRSSSFRYKGDRPDVERIGEELQVSTVLEGSVRRMGNRVRITTELVAVDGGQQLWTERYDRQLDDVFAIQDETARAIAAQLDIQLGTASGELIIPDRTVNREAYDVYLKGKFCVYQRHRGGLLKALECFEKAISIDADYAPAHVGLSEAHWAFALYLLRPNDTAMRQARKHAQRAMHVAPALPEARFSAGVIQLADWNFDASEASLRHALSNPSHGIPNGYLALLLAVRGRADEAREQIEASLLKEPFSAYMRGLGAAALMIAGDHAGAAELAVRGLEFDADSYPCHYLSGLALAELGRAADGISHVERAIEISNRAPIQLGFAAYVLARAGERKRARELTRELEGLSKTEYVASLANGFAAAGLGDWDRAHQLLDSHCQPGQAAFFWCLILDGRFDDFADRVRQAPGTRSGGIRDGTEP